MGSPAKKKYVHPLYRPCPPLSPEEEAAREAKWRAEELAKEKADARNDFETIKADSRTLADARSLRKWFIEQSGYCDLAAPVKNSSAVKEACLTDSAFSEFIHMCPDVLRAYMEAFNAYGYNWLRKPVIRIPAELAYVMTPTEICALNSDLTDNKTRGNAYTFFLNSGFITYLGMMLGLGLKYFDEYKVFRTGDASLIERRKADLDFLDKWLDDMTNSLTGEWYQDFNFLNFDYGVVHVRDGRITDSALVPYISDIIIPELLMIRFDVGTGPYDEKKIMDARHALGGVDRIRKIQTGCALAVLIGRDAPWFISIVNNAVSSLINTIEQMIFIDRNMQVMVEKKFHDEFIKKYPAEKPEYYYPQLAYSVPSCKYSELGVPEDSRFRFVTNGTGFVIKDKDSEGDGQEGK